MRIKAYFRIIGIAIALTIGIAKSDAAVVTYTEAGWATFIDYDGLFGFSPSDTQRTAAYSLTFGLVSEDGNFIDDENGVIQEWECPETAACIFARLTINARTSEIWSDVRVTVPTDGVSWPTPLLDRVFRLDPGSLLSQALISRTEFSLPGIPVECPEGSHGFCRSVAAAGTLAPAVVPGPIAGAGLPVLMALGGFVWARRRKAAAIA